MMVDIREYHDRGDHSPFRQWYDRLNAEAARKVTTALYRVGLGNFSNAKSVGAVFTSARLILAQAIECILGKKASRSSSFLAAERNSSNRTTSIVHSNDGKTTSRERSNRKRKKGNEHGFDTRF